MLVTQDPKRGVDLWPAIMTGCPEAGIGAMVLAPNRNRGRIVRVAYRAKVPVAAFRAMLQAGWVHDHHWLQHAAGGPGLGERRTLERWFDRADFDVSHLPDPVSIYRGAALPGGTDWPMVALGYAWTLKQKTAKFFAAKYFRNVRVNSVPIVVSATVPRSMVKAHFRDRKEEEVVVLLGSSDLDALNLSFVG